MLAVAARGERAGWGPVTRSGARGGDRLAVAGRLGRSAAGLALVEAGIPAAAGAAGAAGFAGLMASHRRPRPLYDAGPEAADLGATSMIDISDGLVADLRHVAEASGVLVNIETARLPGDPALRSAASALATDWLGWVRTRGDGHGLAV